MPPVILTRPKRATSDHDRSITCHASAIQKGADLSCCCLSGHPHCLHRDRHNRHYVCRRRYASIVDWRRMCHQAHWWITEELILPGIYLCSYGINGQLLRIIVWTHYTVWEVLALCLTVRIAVKQFCELQQFGPLTGRTISNIFRVLLQTHVVYFARWTRFQCGCILYWSCVHASFIGASCFNIGTLSSHISVGRSVANISMWPLFTIHKFFL